MKKQTYNEKTNIMSVLRLLFFTLALCPLTAATAAVVNYNEAVDGDLGEFYYGTQGVLNFDIGANTVSGNTGWAGGYNPQDRDEFNFIIPTNTRLTSISYAFNNITTTTPGPTSLGVDLGNPFTPDATPAVDIYVIDLYTQDTSPVALFASWLPAGAGTYDWTNPYFITSSATAGGFWDYTITFNVSPVPVPAAVWLFGSGLLGLVGMARRKKAA